MKIKLPFETENAYCLTDGLLQHFVLADKFQRSDENDCRSNQINNVKSLVHRKLRCTCDTYKHSLSYFTGTGPEIVIKALVVSCF